MVWYGVVVMVSCCTPVLRCDGGVPDVLWYTPRIHSLTNRTGVDGKYILLSICERECMRLQYGIQYDEWMDGWRIDLLRLQQSKEAVSSSHSGQRSQHAKALGSQAFLIPIPQVFPRLDVQAPKSSLNKPL